MKKTNFIFTLIFIAPFAFAEVPVIDYSTSAYSTNAKPTEPPAATPRYEPIIPTSNLSDSQRLNKLEQQINNLNEQNLISKIDELQQRLQKLNGQIEDQAHQIEQLTNQLRISYKDLNERLQKTKKGEPVLPGAQKSNMLPVTTSDVVEAVPSEEKIKANKTFLKEQKIYQAAIDMLPGKKYTEAGSKLREYLKVYPRGAYVPDAHYWLGEINFLQKNYDAAEEEFNIVVTKYQKSKRVSDAMLKLALSHQNQGRETQAKQELQKIIKRYPGTSAARLAKLQLEGN